MKLAKRARVLVLERDARVRERLVSFLEARPDMEAASGRPDMEVAPGWPDAIIWDLREPTRGDMPRAPVIGFGDGAPAGLSLFDRVSRPADGTERAMDAALRMLAFAVRRACMAEGTRPAAEPPSPGSGGPELIAIGASAGGTEAILGVLAALPADAPPVLVVQHIAPGFAQLFASHVARRASLGAKVAADGERALRGMVYVAPDGMHMRLERAAGGYLLRCAPGERVSGHLPSVDALFLSVAEQAGAEAVGVLLTGMGRDGAEGLLRMRAAGARTIGQDEGTSAVYGMPRAAFEMGAVEAQMPLSRIGPELAKRIRKGE